MQSKEDLLTWFVFKVFKKFPRLLTIPCQWAIKAFWASVFATERDEPLTKLALDVLGAYLIKFKQLCNKSLNLKGNVANEKIDKFIKKTRQQNCYTWMHSPSKGEISFFKLSRIIPYIFST